MKLSESDSYGKLLVVLLFPTSLLGVLCHKEDFGRKM
jgi:hypothetical protein